jgi:tripartite-type tricarboxylate transporter receptor subunit TctC
MARLIGQWLSERLGQQFVIENRPGAGTNIATEAVVRAAPDGYTLLTCLTVNAINATLYDKLNFNFIRDIAPVASIARTLFAIEVHPSVPVKTVPEFIAYAKANPGKINMASAGIGSGNHVAGELMTGVNLVHVPYRGAGPALVDLLGGQVQVMFASMVLIDRIRQGRQTSRAGIRSRRSSPIWVAHRSSVRPPTSASSSPTKPRSGPKSSAQPTSSRSECGQIFHKSR